MGRTYKQDLDRASIEELAATLESKIVRDERERPGEEAVALEERSPAEQARKPAASSSLPPLLVAHADPGVRDAVRRALERHFTVLEAADGEEAWETLCAHRDIRLLLTGTELPRLDGIELIRRLRRPHGPSHLVGVPVMVYADREDPATKQTVLLAGANDYLLPETGAEALLARVQARNRLFEQSRRAMNLTGTMPTARAGRAEVSNGSAEHGYAEAGEARARSSFERPIWVEARGAAKSVPARPRSWVERLYRISSTTTITLTATVLVILAITLMLLLNQTPRRPPSLAVGHLDTAPPVASEPAAAPQTPIDEEPITTQDSSPPAETKSENASAPPPVAKATAPTDNASPAASGRNGAEKSDSAPSRTQRNAIDEARRPPSAESRSNTARTAAQNAPAPTSTRTSPPRAMTPAPVREESSKPPAREARAATHEGPSPSKVEQPRPPASQPTTAMPPARAGSAPREEGQRTETPAQGSLPSPSAASGDAPVDTSVAAVTAPAAASPPPRPVAARLSREELSALLQRFVSVYEAGDIEQFMALLADNVQTNDRVTRQAVREDYDRLFRTTDLREMRIDTMNWDVEDDRAHGWGEFEVRVRRQGDGTVHQYQGSITVQVRKAGGRPRIERLYHSERRASR